MIQRQGRILGESFIGGYGQETVRKRFASSEDAARIGPAVRGAGKRGGVFSKRKPGKSKNAVLVSGTPSCRFAVWVWNVNTKNSKTDP